LRWGAELHATSELKQLLYVFNGNHYVNVYIWNS
jgi:hypothetical protein